MPNISVSDELLESCRVLLESRGVSTTGLKSKDIIARVIKYALGDTESLFHSPLPRRIEKWKERSLVFKSGGALAPEPLLPPKLLEGIRQRAQELHEQEQVLNLPDNLESPPVDPGSLPRPRQLPSSTPPWTELKRIPLEEAHKHLLKKHSLLKWASTDKLKRIAAEVALAYVPRSMYMTPVLYKTAEELYQKFLQYNENNA